MSQRNAACSGSEVKAGKKSLLAARGNFSAHSSRATRMPNFKCLKCGYGIKRKNTKMVLSIKTHSKGKT